MSSHAQDSSTQKAASSGAQGTDATLDANAAQNQQFSNNARKSMFGNYNPQTGSYSGGTVSSFLNPSNLNPTSLSGSYLSGYNQAANNNARGAVNSVGTTMQNMANRGMGKSPAGFSADQMRQAYQTAAGDNGANYSTALTGQHNEALNNYWNANNLLNSNASQTANLSVQGNQAAAGNYASLYGTASQQVQNPALGIIGALSGAGAKGVTL